LKRSAQQFDWILNEKKRINQLQELEQDESEKSKDKQHVMISYNTKSREMCLKIKEELERANLKVWMDVSDIHGSSLDSMAKAVENSMCVLICITEKYRQSNNCQAEAQYAFRLNKTIIPLIMQKDYHNVNGWLGIIIGDKIFVDFTKYEFDDSINRLKKQIQLTTQTKITVERLEETRSSMTAPIVKTCSINKNLIQKDQQQQPPQPVDKQHHALNWNEKEVENWLTSKNLSNLYGLFAPCDGKLLYQLYKLQIHTPEFFYKSITENQTVNVVQVARFSSILKELFES
jgi:male-specific lethal 1